MPTNQRDLLRFWTPAQVKLYTKTHKEGLVWIDDAVGVDLTVQDRKTPVFGYRSRYFDGISEGQTIVSGNLYIQFRYPGYLTKLLKILGLRHNPKEVSPLNKEKAFEPTEDEPDGFNLIEDSLISGNIKQYLEFVEEFKNVYYNEGSPVSQTKRPAEVQNQDSAPFNIQIVYGDRELDTVDIPTYIIEDVFITNQGNTISALDGRGDQVLLEVYQFFARNLVIR